MIRSKVAGTVRAQDLSMSREGSITRLRDVTTLYTGEAAKPEGGSCSHFRAQGVLRSSWSSVLVPCDLRACGIIARWSHIACVGGVGRVWYGAYVPNVRFLVSQ